MEYQLIPQEATTALQVISKKEKKEEILSVLVNIFKGTEKWEQQVDEIEVKDIYDNANIQLAETYRKNAKNQRLDAEKIFNAKRKEVQQLMSDYKVEDQLWLKLMQIMQIKLKAVEEKAEFKATFRERYEKEQRDKMIQERLEKCQIYKPEILKSEIENLTTESFEVFYKGLEQAYIDEQIIIREQEEKAAELKRINDLHRERKESILDFWSFLTEEQKSINFGTIYDEEWVALQDDLIIAKQAYDNNQKELEEKNEALKQEIKEVKNNFIPPVKIPSKSTDKDKILIIRKMIMDIKPLEMQTEQGKKLQSDVMELLSKIVNFINLKSESL